MKKYKVNDLQGCNFMDYTHDNPLTANQLRSQFWSLNDGRTEKYKDFTIAYIQDLWELEFELSTNKKEK